MMLWTYILILMISIFQIDINFLLKELAVIFSQKIYNRQAGRTMYIITFSFLLFQLSLTLAR